MQTTLVKKASKLNAFPVARNVVVMKWGTLYSHEYVNVIFEACRRNISGDFRFICLTDDDNGILPSVECFPIPDIGLKASEYFTKAVWPKLALFVPELYDIEGRILFVDLDMFILGSLDEFFTFSTELVCTDMGAGWRPGFPAAKREAGTCIFSFDSGSESQIVEQFRRDYPHSMTHAQNEQEYVGKLAKSVDYWPNGWVISFKRFLRQPIGLDLFLGPKPPPSTARVLAFHGRPRPASLISDRAGYWDRLPHMGNGQVQWAKDYWIDHGGTVS